MTTKIKDEDVIAQVVDKLVGKFPSTDPGTVTSIVREEFQQMADRPVRDYLSVLTERAARSRLSTLVA